MKVLVVDDIRMARCNMIKALERENIEAIEAANGKEALELVQSEKPDIVSLDIDMPDISGIEVLKTINTIDSDINVIMVTAYSSQYNFVETHKLGVKHFLVKPIDLNKFIEIVKSFDKRIY